MPRYAFQIGQNRTATRSISHVMEHAGYVVCRWSDGAEAETLWANARGGRPLLAGLEGVTGLTDLDPSRAVQERMWHPRGPAWEETAGWALFRELYEAHPDALFVHNTRPEAHWVASIRRLYADWFPDAARLDAFVGRRLAARTTHAAEVRRFFAARPEADYLEVDVERPDAGRRLLAFFGLPPDCGAWKHMNRGD